MTNSKRTKRALLMSVCSMLLCLTMLIGATFAWFTDSVSTGKNTIKAGNLDVDLLYKTANGYEPVTADTDLFMKDALWEPGHVEVVNLKVANLGTLALKYQFSVNVVSETPGTNVAGKEFKLSDYIKFAVVDGEKSYTGDTARVEAIADAEAASPTSISALNVNNEGELYLNGTTGKNSEECVTLIVYMPTTVGNEANYRGETVPQITLGVNLVATQTPYEEDSFGDDYDESATLDFTPVTTAAELAAAIEAGENVSLVEDVQLTEMLSVTGDVTIQGNGNALIVPNPGSRVIDVSDQPEAIMITLNGVDIQGPTSGESTRGISIYNNSDVTLVMDNCSVVANYYAINVASENKNINVVVKNTDITGWCAVQSWSANANLTFENCTLSGVNDKTYNADGWNGFATIVVNVDAVNNTWTFKNCRIEASETTGNRQDFISIRIPATITVENCTFVYNGTELSSLEEVFEHVVFNNVDCVTGSTITIDGEVLDFTTG